MSISSERVKAWRLNTKNRMIDAMGGKCQCCGYNRCTNALAFHHIDPTIKELSFGSVRANPKSWKKITDELKKSILVCHNCHSEIHAGIRELPEVYSKFDEKYLNYKSLSKIDICPVCNGEKLIKDKTCGNKCAAKLRGKVNWDNIDLLELLKVKTVGELEKELGVSNTAIYKRKKKLLKETLHSSSGLGH